jgi:anti-sigma factor RsiW
MGHRPFETWIFERDELSFDQERQLSSHLVECERCQVMATALTQVDQMFQVEPLAAPAAGFTRRWKRRLERRQRRRTRIYSIATASLILGGLVITAWLAGSALWDWSLSVADQLAFWLENVVRFVAQIQLTGRLYTILVENFLSEVPAGVWMSLGTLAAVTLTLWMVSARRIVFRPS